MDTNSARQVAAALIRRHGIGASLLSYERVVRMMRASDRQAAEAWCMVLVEVEAMLVASA